MTEPLADRDLDFTAEFQASCPFGPAFFAGQLRGLVRERCPDPREGLPSVQLHLGSGERLDLCHVIGFAPAWVALAVWESGSDAMRTELVPYESIALSSSGTGRCLCAEPVHRTCGRRPLARGRPPPPSGARGRGARRRRGTAARDRERVDPAEPPPPGMGNDFHVSVSIVVWNGENVLAIPSTALVRSGDHWAVFAIRDGRARLTLVTPGPSDSARTVVVDGLSEGQRVIVQPSDLIRDGTRVKGP